MEKPMTKLPALTAADIEALPSNVLYCRCEESAIYRHPEGEDEWIEFNFFDQKAITWTSAEVAETGGITARLVDPAPLEALLREAMTRLENLDAHYYDGAFLMEIEAALEGNDG